VLSKDDILNIIGSELSNSEGCDYSGTNGLSLEGSLDAYLGLPNGTEVKGRSQIMSTDIADAIEWIMPQVMKSFTQNNEVVVFDPVHEGDERQAEMESEYVYEVLMKQNDGFIILHQFVKDALMQRNGILKSYYAKINDVKTENWTGITESQFQQLLSAEGVELLEQSEYVDEKQTEMKQQQLQMQMQQLQQQVQQVQQAQPQPQQLQQMHQQMMQLQEEMQKPVILYDVKVSVERIRGQVYVDPVPPEEFKYNSMHNSINLDNARFTSHNVVKTASDIRKEFNIDENNIQELPEGADDYTREYRFSAQGESAFYGDTDSEDESQKEIELNESFLQIDIDQVGISKLMKITTAGGDTPTDLLEVAEIDSMPWVSTTAFLMSHKFQGLSITDRLIQIQEQKTALIRSIMDNTYLQNNQRLIVVPNMVEMDDLLVSRPGGIIRAKRADAVTPLITPPLGADAYNMIEYLDRARAGRTGVDPDGSATPQNIGDRVGSQGVERLMNAKEELVGLIIRVIAETGIKPLCIKIRDLSVQHVDSVEDFRFRGAWQKVNPAEWLDRTKCTVRVGTGSGNHMAQVAALRELMVIQEKVLGNPQQSILDQNKVFTALDDFCKFSGLNGATRYFIDPASPEGKNKAERVEKQSAEKSQKNDQIQQTLAQSQIKLSEAENAKAQAQMVSAQAKAQADQAKNQLQLQKQTFEGEINLLQQQLEEAKAVADNMGDTAKLQLDKYKIDQDTAIALTKIEADSQKEENKNYSQNEETISE